MMRIMCAYVWNAMVWHNVMRSCMNEYTYMVGQYEFSDSHKARMVSLPRGLCRVKVKGFRSFISV